MSDESGSVPGTLPLSPTDGRRGPGRRPTSVLSLLIKLVALVILLVVAAGAISFGVGWRPSFNPFKHETITRDEPAVLRSVQTISDFHAATAHLEVVVDIQDKTKWIPTWLSGEQTLFVGVGTVDSVVSFEGLDAKRVVVSEDGTSVTIKLPPPKLGDPQLDLKKSYVVARQRGALTRLGNALGGQSTDQALYVEATKQMATAAKADGQVLTLGKQNTVAMLRGLLEALGFKSVTVTFDDDKA